MRRDSEAGIYVVLFAAAVIAIVSLFALALGLGLVAMSATKIQQVANVAALGALKRYIEARAEPGRETDWAYQLDEAIERAEQILIENRVWGAAMTLEGLGRPNTPGEAGYLLPGSYFPEDPDGPGSLTPCTSYPCFLPVDSLTYAPATSLPVNAIRISLQNTLTNPVVAPFASLMGSDKFQIDAEATGALVQKCTALVLDVSISTTEDSHPMPAGNWDDFARIHSEESPPLPNPYWQECDDLAPPTASPPYKVLCPNDSVPFAMRLSDIYGGFTNYEPWTPADIDPGSTFCRQSTNWNRNGTLPWCNLLFQDGDRIDLNEAVPLVPGGAPQLRSHYWAHYMNMPSPFGMVRIDRTLHPQPLANFLLAFNAALRLVKQQTTGADKVVVLPFTGRIRGRFPEAAGTASDDLDFVIQATNYLNRGTVTEWSGNPPRPSTISEAQHPNYVDLGWFPLLTADPLDGNTHIVAGLQAAINTLADTNVCPATAQKHIVLATDGMSSCANVEESGQLECFASLETYNRARNQLIGPEATSIRNQLIQRRISLTTVLSGNSIQTNFRHAASSGTGWYAPIIEQWLESPRDYSTIQSIFDGSWSGTGVFSDEDAYTRAGLGDVVFRDPNRVFAFLSLDSGGSFCPMMDLCTNCACSGSSGDCYDSTSGDLISCARPPLGDFFRCSPRNTSPGEQAARCVSQSIGGNPYILVK